MRGATQAPKNPLGTVMHVVAGQSRKPYLISGDIYSVSLQLFAYSHTGGGVAEIQTCVASPTITISPDGMTLGEALRSAIKQSPGYTLYIAGGVPDILPASGPPPLLNTRFQHFDFVGNRRGLYGAITTSGPYRSVLNEIERGHRIISNGEGLSAPAPTNEPDIAIHLHDVTLMEILNFAVRAGDEGSWVYSGGLCGRTLNLTWHIGP